MLAGTACVMQILCKCDAIDLLFKDCLFILMSRGFINQGEDMQQHWDALCMRQKQ